MIEGSLYEQSGLLVENWYVAGESKELDKGKPLGVKIMDIPIVMWRLKNGNVVGILDKCNHRNAPLSEGKIKDDCISCPYHGWVYNKEGICIEIPSEGPCKNRIPNKKVEEFPIKEIYGLIWIWMGRSVKPNSEPFEMPKFKKNGWNSYYMVTDFKSNVTDLVENFMDVPHTIFVHKGWFREPSQICIKANVERTKNSVLITYDQPNDSVSYGSWLINPKKLPLKHTDSFYMPNITRVDYVYGENERAFIITSTCTPISRFETKVYTLISYKLGWLNPISKMVLPYYTRKVIDQDVWIMNIHGNNLKSFKNTDYKSTQADTMHLFIESLRDYAESNCKSTKPLPKIKEIEFWV